MPNKFRRGDRVWNETSWTNTPIRFGTVLNPKPDQWGYISVRLDSQQSFERGMSFKEKNLTPLTTGETQFHLRTFDYRFVTYGRVTQLRRLIDGEKLTPDEMKALRERFYEPEGYVP